jgi:hypothetical protein
MVHLQTPTLLHRHNLSGQAYSQTHFPSGSSQMPGVHRFLMVLQALQAAGFNASSQVPHRLGEGGKAFLNPEPWDPPCIPPYLLPPFLSHRLWTVSTIPSILLVPLWPPSLSKEFFMCSPRRKSHPLGSIQLPSLRW